mgnify:FL=1|jgi:cell division protein FtsI/penicillin-binding protein 2
MGGQDRVRPGASTVCSRRIVLVLVAGAILSVILIGRAAWLAGRRGTPEAVDFEELCIPGLRGSILDRNGKPLAWSERRLRLAWQLPQDSTDALAIRERLQEIPELQKHLPTAEELPELLGQKLVLVEALSGSLEPELLVHVESGDLLLEGYFIRQMSGHPEVIGQVAVDPVSGLEVGVSGLEKEYDRRLRGKVLRYARTPGSSRLTRLYDSFLTDSGNGENVVVEIF